MPILVSCECGEQFREHDACAGRQARCPGCGRVLVIPTVGGEARAIDEIAWCEPERPGVGTSRLARIVASLSGKTGRDENASDRQQGHGRARSRISLGRVAFWLGVICLLLYLLLPAGSGPSEPSRRAQCVNNLKQIGLALHNYHDIYGCFPPAAITDPSGKPLLSWRVALLPFMEQQGLYARFKLDEPWNSPNNRALMAERPMVFACPSDTNLGTSATRYLGLNGPGAFFEGTEGTRIESFLDGTSNTFAVVEARDAVLWTAPADLSFLPRGPLPAMKSAHPRGFNALFADGSVRFLMDSTSSNTLRGLITRNASESDGNQSY